MAKSTANDARNVSTARGIKGGYFRSGPEGSKLPVDNASAPDEALAILGYISEDGLTESVDEDVTDIPDMNGDTVYSAPKSHTKTFGLTLIETKAGALREYFGDGCVTDADGVITVAEESGRRKTKVYIADLLLADDRRLRIVIPRGKVTEVGEITYSSGETLGYEITVTAYPDDDGKKTYRYIDSTETDAPAPPAKRQPAAR